MTIRKLESCWQRGYVDQPQTWASAHGPRDTAKRPRGDHTVELPGVKRQCLGTLISKINGDLTPADPRLREPAHLLTGIDGGQIANVRRVMFQVETRAKANFQDLALHIGQHFFPKLSEFWRAHRPVAETREDEAGIKAHGCVPSVNRTYPDDRVNIEIASSQPSFLLHATFGRCGRRFR